MTRIAPIKDEASHRVALIEIDRLWGAPEGTPEGDQLDVFMTLVDAYERMRWPVEDIDPIDAVKARMENAGRTRKEFEAIVGSSGRASEILNRRRHLTLAMIWKLAREWKIPADLLIQPYKLSRAKKRANPRAPKANVRARKSTQRVHARGR
jgi:HTH-type transcriptional regulator/antitoxin HigA